MKFSTSKKVPVTERLTQSACTVYWVQRYRPERVWKQKNWQELVLSFCQAGPGD